MELTLESVLGRARKGSFLGEEELQFLEGKSVLITGGAGSIGFRLAKTILFGTDTTQVVLVDIDESRLHSCKMSLSLKYRIRASTYLADLRDLISISAAVQSCSPQIVIHAAALKHVSVLENHPRESFLTNVIGTANLLKAIHERDVQNFVFISTDKAANPSSILGSSKLIGELLCQEFAQNSSSIDVSIVRFGNVFLSRGSVLETFLNQIHHKEDLTVTHPDVTRYFIDLNEASELICKVLAKSQSGISILKMGEPVKIYDVAKNLIRLSEASSKIVFIGLKQGEKLHEDLYTDTELHSAIDMGAYWNVRSETKSTWFLSDLVIPDSNLNATNEMQRIINANKI